VLMAPHDQRPGCVSDIAPVVRPAASKQWAGWPASSATGSVAAASRDGEGPCGRAAGPYSLRPYSVGPVWPICRSALQTLNLLFAADQLCAARLLRPQNLKRRHGAFWIEHSLQLGRAH
jgi:hypothetical protein